MKRTTLDILEKLDTAHIMRIRSLQDRTNRDQLITLQLGQLSSKLEELKDIAERSATEYRILESLRYHRMEARQEKIIDAHAQTFKWIFDSSSQLSSKANFVEWLTNGNDIFWITGKAGSGKSTLMKFLSHHRSSTSALQRWAGDKELITATFYFWYAGTELQKSQQGLLQSLLHGLLSQCPEIMPQVISKRWELCTRTQYTDSRWTRAELLDAFAQLSNQHTLKKRFCFFIDGLDEYDGDHSEVVDLVQGFARSRDIKVCLSSRPWNVFTRAFGLGSHPKFHLEDLTQQDIKSYVQDTLGGNKLFCQLAEGKDSARCRELENGVVCRAQGVFLWVFLVVRSLMEGLTNADRITDLERRLESLPTDLEAYFRHMLENIEEFYVQQTVQTFHVALQAVEPLSLMTYAMMDELEENPRYAIELPVQQMTTTDIESQCQDMKLRINARCKDLLQITRKKVQKVRKVDSVNTVDLSRLEALPLSKPNPLSETLLPEPNIIDDGPYTLSRCKEVARVRNASESLNIETDETSDCEQPLHPFEPNLINDDSDTFSTSEEQARVRNASESLNIETDETSDCEQPLHPFEPNLMNDDSGTWCTAEEQALIRKASVIHDMKTGKISNCEQSLHPFFEYEVDFLHRTVKDFFKLSDVQRFIASRIPETFNSCALLCHAFLAQIKVAPIELHHFNQPGELSDLVDDLAHYAHQVETQTARPTVELLDELSDVIRVHRDSLRKRWFEGFRMETFLTNPSMNRLCQSILGFAVQRDLRLYVTHKLDERLRWGSPTSEFDELVLDALEPSVTSKYDVPSPNLALLRLLVDRGVDLNRTPLSVRDQIIDEISSKWTYSTEDTRVYRLEMVIALLEVGADPNWSQWQDRLGWVKFVLIPSENWRTRSLGFETVLTRTIVAFCERGIDPYWEFEGYTLWSHFIRSIYDGARTYAPLSLQTTGLLLVVIKKFIGLGAQLDDVVYHDVDKYEKGFFVGLECLSVTDVLTRILTKKQLEELELLQRRGVQKSSRGKASGAQRRMKKKKRKERRKVLGC